MYKITRTRTTLTLSPNGAPFSVQENKFRLAHRVYTRALGIVNDEHLYKDEEKTASAEVRNTLRLNLAAVLLKLDEGLEAKEHCVKVLTNDETNVKAYFRRGQVRRVDVVEAHSCVELSTQPPRALLSTSHPEVLCQLLTASCKQLTKTSRLKCPASEYY